MIPITEYRPGRNFIRVGDTVKCKPKVGKSFKAVVTQIAQRDETGEIEITVIGGKPGFKAIRTFTPDKIDRVAQTRVEGKP